MSILNYLQDLEDTIGFACYDNKKMKDNIVISNWYHTNQTQDAIKTGISAL